MKHQKRISSYDGLKGISIIAIVLYHLFPSVMPGGFLTVNAFFAVAGYFFTYKIESFSFNRDERQLKQIFQYIKSTIGRLFFPLLWMMGSIIVAFLIIDRDQLNYFRNDLFSGLFFYNNLYQIAADKSYFVRMTEASPFTHLWYNSLYIQSFLIAIVGVLITKLLDLRGATKAILWSLVAFISHVALLWLYVPGQDPSRVYYGLDTRLSSFILGVVIAYAIPVILNLCYKMKHKRTLFYFIGILSLIGFWVMPFIVSDQQPETYYFFMPLYSVVSMGLIFSITVGVPLVRKIFELPPLPWVGQRSYSYYLWYYPVIVFWMKFQRQFEGQMHWLYLGIFVSLFVLSELLYQLIERRRLIFPFVTSFDWKDDWRQFKLNNRSPWLIPFGFVFLSLTGMGLVMSKNDKPLAQFRLEYQLQQTQQKMFDIANPQEREIAAVNQAVANWEKELEAPLLSKIEVTDFFDTVKVAINDTTMLDGELSLLVSENQAVLDQIAANDPDLAALVPTEVQLFAAETPVSFFGDSLILLSAPNALSLFLNSNNLGVKSLQIWYAGDYLSDWIATGEVNDILVVNLGTNAGLDEEGMDAFIETAGERKIFFVNCNSAVAHRDSVNEIIHQYAEEYDNVYEIDWYSYSKEHPEYYWEGEEIHHTPEGADHFAALVAQELYRVLGGNQ